MSDRQKTTVLSDAEKARLERMERTRRNARGRRNPSVLPSKLARSAAFAPRSNGLSADGDLVRVMVVKPYSVVEVRGRELGTRHRDAVMALFRLRARVITLPGQDGSGPTPVCQTEATWREILAASHVGAHVNNLLTLLKTLEELRSVTVRMFKAGYEDYERAVASGRLAGAGWSDGLIRSIEWDGVNLDSKVRVEYGRWVRETLEARRLVSVSADVYFRLKSEHAKACWPYIESQPDHSWVGIETLAQLCGRDYAAEDTRHRNKLRQDLAQAFRDLVAAGGLSDWSLEVMGSGKARTYRYRYTHALPKQLSLSLAEPAARIDPTL